MKNIDILVVEDEAIIGMYVKDTLVNMGYNVTAVVPTGEEAIKKVQEFKPNLILMDIVLSGQLNGIDTSNIIKKSNPIPIVYMTGNANFSTVKEARETNPYGYILKPINIQSLYSTIDTALNLYDLEMKLKEKNEESERANEELLAANEELQTTLDHLEEAEIKLLEYKNVIESSQEMILVIDKEYRYLIANKAFLNYRNLKHEQVIGLHVKEIIGEDAFNNQVKAILDRCFKGETIQYERDFIYPKLGKRHLLVTNYPIENSTAINSVAIVVRDITEKKITEEKLKSSLEEKEVLLKEIHHRVKNNFQIIISLLGLQSKNIKEKNLLGYFNDSINRIRSIALVHENLYHSKDLTKIDFSSYIELVILELYNIYYGKEQGIKLNFNLEKIFLSIDKAIPCGLINNELITNCLKYAYITGKTDDPQIDISFKQKEGNRIEFIIEDNGVGIKDSIKINKSGTFGLNLVSNLSDQINGKFDIIKKDRGTKFVVEFVND